MAIVARGTATAVRVDAIARRARHPVNVTKQSVLLTIGLVIWLVTAPSAVAQEPGIVMTAKVGFDGLCRLGEWAPVRVTLANSGPDVEGFVEVESSNSYSGDNVRYRTPVVLPGQSRKTVTLFVSIEQYMSRLPVRLVAGDRTLIEVRFSIDLMSAEHALYAVVSGDPLDLNFLEALGSQVKAADIAYLQLEDLPAVGVAWGAIDVLVLDSVDTGRLSPEQQEALRAWLSDGGHLVATGGLRWQETAAGLANLLPVNQVSTVSVPDLAGLDRLTGTTESELHPGPYLVAEGTPSDGTVLLSQENLPLLVRRTHGRGTVDWLALELSSPPLRDGRAGEALWQVILSGDGRSAAGHSTLANPWAVRDGLRSIPSLSLPSTLQMVLFLAAYVLLVGPLNCVLLRRLRRTELAWLTIPAIVVLFSGLAYLTGFQLRGGQVVLNRLTLVHGSAGADHARANTVVGVFSPHRATYDVTFPSGALVRPFSDVYNTGLGSSGSIVVERAQQVVVRDLKVDVAALRAFRVDSHVQPPDVDSGLVLQPRPSPSLTGWVQNASALDLQSAVLIVGSDILTLGDLAPGQTAMVDLSLSAGRAMPLVGDIGMGPSTYSGAFPSSFTYLPTEELLGSADLTDKATNRRFQLLQGFLNSGSQSIFRPNSVTLLAWSEEAPWSMQVTGKSTKTVDTLAYLLEVPLRLPTGLHDWVIPPALTTWEALAGNRNGSEGPYDFSLLGGWVGFEFRPWDALAITDIRELVLTLESSQAASQPVTVSLWDWTVPAWQTDPNLTWGANRVTAPDRWVGPHGAIRVRVESANPAWFGIDRLDVTFVGTGSQPQDVTAP